MSDVTITISLKQDTTELVLTDSEGHTGPPEGFITTVDRGDRIIWRIASNAGIDALTGISAKDGRFNIFNNSDPRPQPDGSWVGKIKDDAAGTDSYNIEYSIRNVIYIADPDVSIKPKS